MHTTAELMSEEIAYLKQQLEEVKTLASKAAKLEQQLEEVETLAAKTKTQQENALLKQENAALKHEHAALKQQQENAALKQENAALKQENAALKQQQENAALKQQQENAALKQENAALKQQVEIAELKQPNFSAMQPPPCEPTAGALLKLAAAAETASGSIVFGGPQEQTTATADFSTTKPKPSSNPAAANFGSKPAPHVFTTTIQTNPSSMAPAGALSVLTNPAAAGTASGSFAGATQEQTSAAAAKTASGPDWFKATQEQTSTATNQTKPPPSKTTAGVLPELTVAAGTGPEPWSFSETFQHAAPPTGGLEPPSKKMKCAPYAYDDDHHGDGHGSQHVEEKIGVTVDGYDLSPAAFRPVPSSKPSINEKSLEAVLEPVNCRKKRNDISKFLSEEHSKKFGTKVDYDSRVRECKTLGRALIGSWCGKTSGDGVTWIHHPFYDFNLWLRIDAKEETLWTCDRGGKWKQNVHTELFPGRALELYKKLWEDKKFLQDYKGKMDPRCNKRAFKPVLADHLSVGRGEDQFKTCFTKFWDSSLRKEMQTKKSKPKKTEELVAIRDRGMQQQQLPGVHLHSGPWASGAACNINLNYHYPSSTAEAARAPAPPAPAPDQSGTQAL